MLKPALGALIVIALAMLVGPLASGSQSTPPSAPPETPTKERAKQSPRDRPNAKSKDRSKATANDTSKEASSSKPRLFVLAAQIDTKVVKRGDIPNSREARLLAQVASERSPAYYSEVQTRVLKENDATRDNILAGLDWLASNVRERDVAIVFLAGHGGIKSAGEVTTDYYHYGPLGGKITGSELRERFDKIAGRNVLFLQTCHANGVLHTADGERPFRNTLVICACDDDEGATKLMGRQMILGLAGSAAADDGRVTTDSLALFLAERVKTLSKGKQSLNVTRPKGFEDFPIAPKGDPVSE